MLKNPVSSGIRNDAAGSGYWHAPRGSRLHAGVDLLCVPGEDVLSPITGKVVRMAYPYAGDLRWKGLVLENSSIRLRMYYLLPEYNLYKRLDNGKVDVIKGEKLGTAQDITNKYPGQGMTPHIHLEIDEIDPYILLDTF